MQSHMHRCCHVVFTSVVDHVTMAIVDKYVLYLLPQTLRSLFNFSVFSLVFVSVAVDVRNKNCAVELKCCVRSNVPIKGHVGVTNAAERCRWSSK